MTLNQNNNDLAAFESKKSSQRVDSIGALETKLQGSHAAS